MLVFFVCVLSFLEVALMAPEANFLTFHFWCSPCHADGGVVPGAGSVFFLHEDDAAFGSGSSSLTLLWLSRGAGHVGLPLHLFHFPLPLLDPLLPDFGLAYDRSLCMMKIFFIFFYFFVGFLLASSSARP